jgi:hypothetical protein
MLCTNFRARYIKLPEGKKVLMVHDPVYKKYGPYLKYQKYTAFTLLTRHGSLLM